ncbi:unnamed protein product [Withania somnifera]
MVSKSLLFNLHPNHEFFTKPKNLYSLRTSSIPTTLTTTSTNILVIQNKLVNCFIHKKDILSPMSSSQYDEFHPDPSLTNDDLKPTTIDQRNFSGWEMASLWIGLVVGVPSYYLAGRIAIAVLANLVILVPLILIGQPGTKFGISFPVLARSSFGIRGAHIPTLLRALVGCGWYGIETWIGGEAIFLLLPKVVKNSSLSQSIPWLGTSPLEFACFITFWIAQLAIVWKGIDGIRELEKYSAPILISLTSCLLIWAYVKAGGFGHIVLVTFSPSLTANIGFWAALALNIPDFTRYAKSQHDQIIGQEGLPIFRGLFTFVGLAVTSSTKVIFGHVISNPITLLGEIGGFLTMVLAILGISLATLTTNIAANVVSPANALVNLSPSRFTFRRGAILTALLGIVCQPWRLLKSSESFVYTWLVGYSALLGPIMGIILADYYLIQRMDLSIKDLYVSSPNGAYYFSSGYNVRAILALVVGILPVIPGFLQNVGILDSIPKSFAIIYNNAWFLSGGLYWILSFLKKNQQHIDPLLPNAS